MLAVGDDLAILAGSGLKRLNSDGKVMWTALWDKVDSWQDGRIVRLRGGDLVATRFGPISDSGVHVMRVTALDGAKRWQSYCQPLEVSHSKYRHRAEITSDLGKLKLTSRGSAGTFIEWLDPQTGKQVRRTREK